MSVFAACPDYRTGGFAPDPKDRLRVSLSFRIDRAKVPFGSLVKQEVELQTKDGKAVSKLVWVVDGGAHGNVRVQPLRTRTISSLRLGEIYVPVVRVHSQVDLPASLGHHYEKKSLLVHECRAHELVCETWVCDDGTEIRVAQVCDGNSDCPLASEDEKEQFCKGFSGWVWVIGGLMTLYSVAGCIAYATVALKFKREEPNDKSRKGDVELIAERERRIWAELSSLLGDLTGGYERPGPEFKDRIQDLYLSLDAQDRLVLIAAVLHVPLSADEEEHVRVALVEGMFSGELMLHDGDVAKAFSGLREACADDVKLFASAVATMDRGLSYKVKVMVKRNVLQPLKQALLKYKNGDYWLKTLSTVLPFVNGVIKVFLFYFDVMKDVAVVFILRHFSEEILRYKYGDIGGINLLIMAYYLCAIVIASLVATFAVQFIMRKDLEEAYSKDFTHSTTVNVLAAFFPLHFSIFEQIACELKESAVEAKMTSLTGRLSGRDTGDSEEVDSFSFDVDRIFAIRRRRHVIERLQNRIQVTETFVERIPQSVVHLALFLASVRYSRLRSLLTSAVEYELGISVITAFVIAHGTTLFSAVTSVCRAKNEKRFPAPTTGTGSILQLLAVSSLMLPKIFMVSVSLIYAPFCYPLVVVVEQGLLLAYNVSLNPLVTVTVSRTTSQCIFIFSVDLVQHCSGVEL